MDLFRWTVEAVGYLFSECPRRIRTSHDCIVTWRRYGPFVHRDWAPQIQARRRVRIYDTRCSQYARMRVWYMQILVLHPRLRLADFSSPY